MKGFLSFIKGSSMAITKKEALGETNEINSIDDIKAVITKQLGYTNFKDKGSKTTMVLVDNVNRVELLQKIEKIFAAQKAVYDVNKGASSVGAVTIGSYTVGASPASKQGKKSAGLDNEDTLIDNINEFVKNGSMDIIFIAGRKRFVVPDVVKAIETGRDTSGRKKSDVNLETKDGKIIPLSLKKDGAEMWESADSYYAATAKKIIDDLVRQGKVELSGGAIKKITPNIAKKASSKEAQDVVFGSDILTGKGAVLYRTWRASDFKVNSDGNLEVTTSKIYTSLREVESGDHSVYFLIRNDSSRRGSKIYPGIRALAVGKTRINRKVLDIRTGLAEEVMVVK